MKNLLVSWSNCGSGSFNLSGLQEMKELLKIAFGELSSAIQTVEFPSYSSINGQGEVLESKVGDALIVQSRHRAPIKVLLSGHYDTVFGETSPFQSVKEVDKGVLSGPGVTDMKGGLIILLYALKAFARSPFGDKIEWEVILSGDEEIGSIGSGEFLLQKGKTADIGLVFEPCLPDGSWVSERVGSANFTVLFRGKSAHAGREFFQGKNALVSAAKLAGELASWSDPEKRLTVNIGYLSGGGAVNIVPDQAVMKFNMRAKEKSLMDDSIECLKRLVEEREQEDQILITLHADCIRPPKIFDEKTEELFESLKQCGEEIGIFSQWIPSGGVCDGNLFGSVGLPTIDTLGALGGGIHTEDEYIRVESLVQRAQLVALFLMKLANGELLDLRGKNGGK